MKLAGEKGSDYNFRVVKRQIGFRCSFGIYNTTRDKNNNIILCSKSPFTVASNNIDEVIETVDLMLEAFNKPTLNYEELGISK